MIGNIFGSVASIVQFPTVHLRIIETPLALLSNDDAICNMPIDNGNAIIGGELIQVR